MNRDYIYHSYTKTFCDKCEKLVDGKIIFHNNAVFILKNCPEHGQYMELLEEDIDYHLTKPKFDKPGSITSPDTVLNQGCPFDCGLCPSHDQHSCIGVIEITKRCNLRCPFCYANGGDGKDLKLKNIEAMMDFYQHCENNDAEILQISGGEPTLHPDMFKIIEMAKEKGFKYVMLNTNGLKIAEDENYAQKLAEYKGGFEVYLQFDGLKDEIYKKLRGRALADIKQRAVRNLKKYGVPVTLVCSVANGINDKDLGEIIVYGMNEDCVRGVNFQPIAFFGRTAGEVDKLRITVSGILNRIEKQTNELLLKNDFMPLPCNVERVALTYLIKNEKNFIPITRGKDMSEYRDKINNTFMFNLEDTLRDFKDIDINFGLADCCDLVRDIRSLIPFGFIKKSKIEKMKFVDENTFRISISSFIDIYNFDMKSLQKECVHIITPDFKRIPFSSYNMLHRGKYDEYYD